MIAIIGIILIIITIVLNRGLGRLIKSKSLKYFYRTQDVEKSLKYIKRFEIIFFWTFIFTLLVLILGFYLLFYEFIEASDLLYYISVSAAIILFLIITIMINQIVLQAEMEIKGSKRNKKQERTIIKFLGYYIFTYILFLFTFMSFIHITTDIYFQRFGFGFYFKIGLVLLGYLISILLSINEKKVFEKIFLAKSLLNDDIVNFVHGINPNVNLYLFESNDLKLANAFAIEGKQKSIFISDYLVNNISLNELKAVMAHELGHFKMKHPIKRSRFIMFGYLLGAIIQYLTIVLFGGYTLYTAFYLIGYLFLYYIVLKNKLYQKHERIADGFMIEAGIDKEDAIKLLEKLSSLNYLSLKGTKRDKILKTHPSIENRINYLKSL